MIVSYLTSLSSYEVCRTDKYISLGRHVDLSTQYKDKYIYIL